MNAFATHLICGIDSPLLSQGLVAFATLLESHTDIEFDFFEAWSLRNIFALPPDLPVIIPHHKGINLQPRPEKQTDLMVEVEDLMRQKLKNVSTIFCVHVDMRHCVDLRRGNEDLTFIS